MIPHYEKKFTYLIEKQIRDTGFEHCPIMWEVNSVYIKPDSLHHTKVHNTKSNKKRYPLLLNSLLNLTPVFNAIHITRGSWGKISEYNADKIERFLERHPLAARFVNDLESIRYLGGRVII